MKPKSRTPEQDDLLRPRLTDMIDMRHELVRLEALRKVNPSIREEELENLRYRIDECAVHISHANLQLQALRLIITT